MYQTSLQETIVPMARESVSFKSEFGHLLVGIVAFVPRVAAEFRLDKMPAEGARRCATVARTEDRDWKNSDGARGQDAQRICPSLPHEAQRSATSDFQ